MRRILHVNSSPRTTQSKSLALALTFLDCRREAEPGTEVDTWNLFDEPLPAYGATAADAKMAAFAGQPLTTEQTAEWDQAQRVFERFAAADDYVFNVPMWNHGVPYVLKQWIDLITQPGWVFGFDFEQGYHGLLQDKRAFVVYTSGVYQAGRPASFGSDFHSTFFNDWLRFVGISDIREVTFGGNNLMYPDAAAAAQHEIAEHVRKVASTW